MSKIQNKWCSVHLLETEAAGSSVHSFLEESDESMAAIRTVMTDI